MIVNMHKMAYKVSRQLSKRQSAEVTSRDLRGGVPSLKPLFILRLNPLNICINLAFQSAMTLLLLLCIVLYIVLYCIVLYIVLYYRDEFSRCFMAIEILLYFVHVILHLLWL